MLVEQWIQAWQMDWQEQEDAKTGEAGNLLLGARQTYEANGEPQLYAEFVKSCMDKKIADGGFVFSKETRDNFVNIHSGRTLFFLHAMTGEEKYLHAIEALMDVLRRLPRNERGVFAADGQEDWETSVKNLAFVLPFYMEYETTFDKKEKYNDIISQVEQMYDNFTKLPEIPSEESIGNCLAMLVDVMEHTSIEIYEQYRKLQDIFKAVLKKCLAAYGQKDCRVIYAVLKACRMGILLKEKYATDAVEAFDWRIRHGKEDGAPSDGFYVMDAAQESMLKREMEA